jgi:hypothetical protein
MHGSETLSKNFLDTFFGDVMEPLSVKTDRETDN